MSAISSINPFPQANALIARFAGSGGVTRPGLRPAEAREPLAPRQGGEIEAGQRRGTMFQRNVDGDSAAFSSRESELTDQERKQVEELRQRDQEVRRHEDAHRAAAGPLFRGGPNFTFQTGPDGQRYAVGGNVQIDTSPGRTPEETITKAAQIRRAALAPAEPSGADRAVAARASRMEAEARQELAAERQAERGGESEAGERTEGGEALLVSGPASGAASPTVDAFSGSSAASGGTGELRSRQLDVYA